MTDKVGIGQGRKPFMQVIRDRLASMGVTFDIQTNKYNRLVAIVYRDEKVIREIGLDARDIPEKKILAVLQRNEGDDRRARYEERFVRVARAGGYKRPKTDA